jgi:protein-tyrosine phosphatase
MGHANDAPRLERTSVLFVCLGNICRSPLAEGVFRAHLDAAGITHTTSGDAEAGDRTAQAGHDRHAHPTVHVDSAGTGAWHAGEWPDPRSREVAGRHGISLDAQRARQVQPHDLERFDWIVAMDSANLRDLEALQRQHGGRARLARLRDWDPDPGDGDVPDPYYGGPDGFDRVFAMVERACRALLDEVVP